jgi:hypothetical protein
VHETLVGKTVLFWWQAELRLADWQSAAVAWFKVVDLKQASIWNTFWMLDIEC